jgi:sugar/nucleoside kinase (ribokinase family)
MALADPAATGDKGPTRVPFPQAAPMTRAATAPPRILVVGDIMTDIVVRPEGPLARGSDRRAAITIRPGGSAANQAAWLAHFGVAVDLVARVGAADSEREAERLRRSGVTPYLAGDEARETGRLIVLIDPDGERSFLTDRGANLALSAADIPDAAIANARLILLSGYSFFAQGPREAAMNVIARARRTPVAVDPASAEFLREAGRENFLAWTKGVAILFPNSEEAAVLTGSDDPAVQCASLAALYPLVVVKRGADGAQAARGEERWRVGAPQVAALDTTGAGDAFVAAFLAARLAGSEIEDAMRRAADAGATASTILGGQPPGPKGRPD